MDLPHPLRIATRQVIINGDHMNAAPCQRIQIGGQCRHQGLPFTGSHLGDLTVVEHHATDELHIKVTHAKHPFTGFAHDGKSLGKQFIKQRSLSR